MAICQRAMPSFSVHLRRTPARHRPQHGHARLGSRQIPVRISPAPTLVAVSRIAGPMAESGDFPDGACSGFAEFTA